ncbi:MAG: hypothetical protein NUV40_03675 [Patescibacteria group bacterium]|nr:hypothetical protein [Patescibacteria group bacterium]
MGRIPGKSVGFKVQKAPVPDREGHKMTIGKTITVGDAMPAYMTPF